MPEYSYICDDCGGQESIIRSIASGPPRHIDCEWCAGLMHRDYRADRPRIAQVMQATYIPSVGREISDQKQMDEAMKHIVDYSEQRLGYTPQLRARHPSDVIRDDPSLGAEDG